MWFASIGRRPIHLSIALLLALGPAISLAQQSEIHSPIPMASLATSGATATIQLSASTIGRPVAKVSLRATDSAAALAGLTYTYRIKYTVTGDVTQHELEIGQDATRQVREARRLHAVPAGTAITVTTVSAPAITGTPPAAIQLVLTLQSVASFNPATAPVIEYDPTNRQIKFRATPPGTVAGAWEYDLEWVFVSSQEPATMGPTAFGSKDPIRVTLGSLPYPIDPTYTAGTIHFRARAVGRHVINGEIEFDARRPGAWSSPPVSVAITPTQHDKNWNYQVAYSEQGARKRSMAFFDGNLRERQNQTSITSENVILVQDLRYDQEGRRSIELLPAPVEPPANRSDVPLDFIPEFTKSETSARTFDWRSFGRIAGAFASDPVNTGAGQYYSSANAISGIHRDYIPDAEKYPYGVTLYTNDDTGRIRESTVPGAAFRLGLAEPRTSRFTYGVPDPGRLKQLFGIDTGGTGNYTKEVLFDPNGQPRVTYKSMDGRVVATALSRDSANVPLLEPVVSSAPPNVPGPIPSVVDLAAGTSTAAHALSISEATHYDFDYRLTGVDHGAICEALSKCATCTYSLDISILNPAGELQPLTLTKPAAGGTPLPGIGCQVSGGNLIKCDLGNPAPKSCSALAGGTSPFTLDNIQFNSDFNEAGTYVVHKVLRFKDGSVDQVLTQNVTTPSPATCTAPTPTQTCFTNCADLCSQYPEVAPNSEPTKQTCMDACNGFATNIADGAGAQSCSGLLADIRRDIANGRVDLMLPGFAASLWWLPWDPTPESYHREYCHLELCKEEQIAGTNAYQAAMAMVTTWEAAVAGGWTNPLGMTADQRGPPASPATSLDPYFTTGPGRPFAGQMVAWLNDFTSTMTGYTGPSLTLWEFVEQMPLLAQTCGPAPEAYKWHVFRAMYMNLKQRIREKVLASRSCQYYDDADAHVKRPMGSTDGYEAIAQIEEMTASYCGQTFCPVRVNAWLSQITSSCPLPAPVKTEVEALLTQYCSQSCSAQNPFVVLTPAAATADPLLLQIQAKLGSCQLPTIKDPFARQTTCKQCCEQAVLPDCVLPLVEAIDNYLSSNRASVLDLRTAQHGRVRACLPFAQELWASDVIEIRGSNQQCSIALIAPSGDEIDPVRVKRLAAPAYAEAFPGPGSPQTSSPFSGIAVRALVDERWVTLYVFSNCPLIAGSLPKACVDQSPGTCDAVPRETMSLTATASLQRALALQVVPGRTLLAALSGRGQPSLACFPAQDTRTAASRTRTSTPQKHPHPCPTCLLDALRLLQHRGQEALNTKAAVGDSPCFKEIELLKADTARFVQFAPTPSKGCQLAIYKSDGQALPLTEIASYESVSATDPAAGLPAEGYTGFAAIVHLKDGSTSIGYVFSTCDLGAGGECQPVPETCAPCLAEALRSIRDLATAAAGKTTRLHGKCFAELDLTRKDMIRFTQVSPTRQVGCELLLVDPTGKRIEAGAIADFSDLTSGPLPAGMPAQSGVTYAGYSVTVKLRNGRQITAYVYSACDFSADPRCGEPQPPPCYACLREALALISAGKHQVSNCFSSYRPEDKYVARLDQKWPSHDTGKGCSLTLIDETKAAVPLADVAASASEPFTVDLLPSVLAAGVPGMTYTGFAVKVRVDGKERVAYIFTSCDLGPKSECEEPGDPGKACRNKQRPGACIKKLFEGIDLVIAGKRKAAPPSACFDSMVINVGIEAMPRGGRKGDECNYRLYDASGNRVSIATLAAIIGAPQVADAPAGAPSDLPANVSYAGVAVFVQTKSGHIQRVYLYSSCKTDYEDDCTTYVIDVPHENPPPNIPQENPACEQGAQEVANLEAQEQCGEDGQSQSECILRSHYTRCFASSDFAETFTATPNAQEYAYTLWYYNQAGNLIQSVPPEGVSLIQPGTSLDSKPAHKMLNRFGHNTRDQVLWQQTPDTGLKLFWYNDAGQLRFSQSAQQRLPDPATATAAHSYIVYDEQGRIIETGVVRGLTDTIIAANINNNEFPRGSVQARSEQVETIYDRPAPECTAITARNLRGRVVATKADNGTYGAVLTCYSYDPHGNIQAYAQYIPNLGFKTLEYEYDLISAKVTRIKYQAGQPDQMHHRYEYDADGRITAVYTSRDGELWDRDAQYAYYKHGPLARLVLGSQRVQGLDLAYTAQGWLKSINSDTLTSARDPGRDGAAGTAPGQEVAPDVIGLTLGYFPGDYKPIRLPTESTWPSAAVFSPTGPTYSDFSSQTCKGGVAASSSTCGLYDGNISSMVVANAGMDPAVRVLGSAFRYDQFGRLNRSRTHVGVDSTQNSWPATATATKAYGSEYTYDLNGNIKTLIRDGWFAGAANESLYRMDTLAYVYEDDSSGPNAKRVSNRLLHIVENDPLNDPNRYDETGARGGAKDIEDQGAYTFGSPSSYNYGYDADGNMVRDRSEGLASIAWNAYGRVRAIHRSTTPSSPDVVYLYDARNNRVGKVVVGTGAKAGLLLHEYSVRDVQGLEVATYSAETQVAANTAPAPSLVQHAIYSGKRLGTWLAVAALGAGSGQAVGDKRYELTDHRLSLLATIADRAEPPAAGQSGVAAGIKSTFDFYPFGAARPYRFSPERGQRYAFLGLEQDTETKGPGNSYYTAARLYDPRVGRWMSPDPAAREQSSQGLNVYHYGFNNPVRLVDDDGKWPFLATGAVVGAVFAGVYVASAILNDEEIDVATAAGAFGAGFVIGSGAALVAAAVPIVAAAPTASAGVALAAAQLGGGAVVAETAADIVQLPGALQDAAANPSAATIAGAVITAVDTVSGLPLPGSEVVTARRGSLGASGSRGSRRSQGVASAPQPPTSKVGAGVPDSAASHSPPPVITKPYSRPSNATNKAQREAQQGQPCVSCGATTPRQVADHKEPLVKEYYRTGTIDLEKMKSLEAVQPQCPTCSAEQGAEMSRYSREKKKEHGF
jgi:RHS repeat-associated protein